VRLTAIWGSLVVAASAAQGEGVISLNFYERPPYMVQQGDGDARGLTADPAAAAFKKAGIAFRWQLSPAKRQLAQIENGQGLECGIGWYKTPERERFAKFTVPIYRDKPTVALARPGFKSSETTLATVVANPAVRVLMKGGLTYGQDVQRIMATAKANVQVVTGEQFTLARMVDAARADFMFSPQEEAGILVNSPELGSNSLRVLTFSDVHEGDTRHIMCSNKVSDDTIARLNRAIGQRVKPAMAP
jgi:polar amino acid transport system substrate-binding protein